MNMLVTTATAFVVATATIGANEASAYQRWVDVVNRGSTPIYSVQISPVSDGYYGPDLLGNAVIPAGDRVRVEPRYHNGYCRFDVKITFDDGSVVTRRRVNLCSAERIIADENHAYTV